MPNTAPRRKRFFFLGLAVLLAAAGAFYFLRRDAGEESAQSPYPSNRAEFQAAAERLFASADPFLGNARKVEYERILAQQAPIERRVGAMVGLSRELLRLGEVGQAIVLIEEAARLARTADIPETVRKPLIFSRALAYWRLGSVKNCIGGHSKLTCLFPIAAGGEHQHREPALEARKSYMEYARRYPGDARPAIWMLNIIAMALGDYPQGLPAPYRLSPDAFRSGADIGRFEDMGAELGLNAFNLAGGVIADDFDGDGLVDLVVSSSDPLRALAFYRNRGAAGFVNATAGSGLEDQLGGLNLIGGDYDDDGDVDVLVLRGAWLQDNGQIRKSLLRNNGNGTFTDVTRAAGLADPPMPTQAAAWGDYDNDGDLDLYVGNENMPGPVKYPAQLYRNEGRGRFTDIALEAGVRNERFAKGVSAGDYDNDGDLDLFVSNIGEKRLYRNDGDMRFTDVAPQLGMAAEPVGRSFTPWWFDYDNDGWLDLFVGAYSATLDEYVEDYQGRPMPGAPPCLYRNNCDGTFTNVVREAGLAHPYLPMGANFGDFDNDGWLDMYLATGDPFYTTLVPNVALRNVGGERFVDISASAGLGHLEKGHGTAFTDFDNDGDQDIFQQRGGFYPGDAFFNALLLNPGHGNRFLTIALAGKKSNSAGIGARIKVVVATPQGTRDIHRAVGSVSSFGGSPFRQEIGLGNATAVARLEVSWPTSRTQQVFENVPLDSFLRITEGKQDYEVLEPVRFDLADVAARGSATHDHP